MKSSVNYHRVLMYRASPSAALGGWQGSPARRCGSNFTDYQAQSVYLRVAERLLVILYSSRQVFHPLSNIVLLPS